MGLYELLLIWYDLESKGNIERLLNVFDVRWYQHPIIHRIVDQALAIETLSENILDVNVIWLLVKWNFPSIVQENIEFTRNSFAEFLGYLTIVRRLKCLIFVWLSNVGLPPLSQAMACTTEDP